MQRQADVPHTQHATMSSELFENYEVDFNSVISKIRKITSQLGNYSGEQRKANVRAAQKEVEEAEDLLQEMEMESRDAPPAYRAKLQNKMTRYKADLDRLKRELGSSNDRAQLFGGGDMQSYEDNQRGRILDTTDRLHQTSDRLANTQRIAAESEAIGHNIMSDLGQQRETIERTRYKVHDVDQNLGRSRKLLNSMSRRIMTNKMIMISIVFILLGILGLTIYLKLK